MSGDTRTPGYRNVFANTFSVSFSEGDVQIKCGVQSNPGSDEPEMEAEMNLIMTHAGAKLLINMVAMIMTDFEDAIGREIPLDPAKLAVVAEAVRASKAAREAAQLAQNTGPKGISIHGGFGGLKPDLSERGNVRSSANAVGDAGGVLTAEGTSISGKKTTDRPRAPNKRK